MSEQRFQKTRIVDKWGGIYDSETDEVLSVNDVEHKLNEQQATINELQSIINHIKCEENCFDYDYCCETVCSLYNEIKHLKEENEQLRTQLLVCQQSKSDNGRIKVWQVPPIPKGMRITTSTTFNGEKDE